MERAASTKFGCTTYKQIHHIKSQEVNFEDYVQLLHKRLGKPESTQLLEKQLQARKQTDAQTISQFIFALKDKMEAARIPQSEQTRRLILKMITDAKSPSHRSLAFRLSSKYQD